MPLPTVAIVGRPNVGKSTLFNRIVGGRRALVDDRPGVTRDRLEAVAEWTGRRFRLIDTGGFEVEPSTDLPGRVRSQSLRAVEEADCVVLVVDARAGIAPADEETARLLGRTGKPVIVAANKVDGERQESQALEFHRLGVGEIVGVSAEHGRSVDELLDLVVARLPEGDAAEEPAAIRVALLGRPNVGKSSLTNRILGEERMVVDSMPGTTRDPIDVRFVRDGESWILVDTAGIRRKSRIDLALERESVSRALRAAERADVSLLVVDASEGVSDQDARLARLVWERGRALVLVVNKLDLVPRERRHPQVLLEEIHEAYKHLRIVPAVFISALQGTGIEEVFAAARRAERAFSTKLATRAVNDILGEALKALEAPIIKGRRARVYYAAPVATRPPTLALFVNDPERMTAAYLRYLENRLREAFPLEGTPLRLLLRARTRDPSRPRPVREKAKRSRARARH